VSFFGDAHDVGGDNNSESNTVVLPYFKTRMVIGDGQAMTQGRCTVSGRRCVLLHQRRRSRTPTFLASLSLWLSSLCSTVSYYRTTPSWIAG